jgi:cell division protein DivIC
VPLSRSPWLSPKRWVILATAVVVVYFIFTAASNTIQAIQIGEDESSLRQEVDDLAERYDQLTALRDYWKSDEYIEWVARQELGLVRPGELGIVVISAATPTPPAEPPQPLWEALSGD